MTTLVACTAHSRCKLFEVFDRGESPIAEEALRRIQELYAIEAEIRGRFAQQRWAVPQARSSLAERLLRGVVVLPKNFPFLGSDRGGDRAACIDTIA